MTLEFAHPYLLLLLGIVPLLALRRRRLARQVGSMRFSSIAIALQAPVSPRVRFAGIPGFLRLLALLLVVVALARPQLGRISDAIPAEGIDIVLAVDVSYSMADTDMAARKSRLQVAKDVIHEFVAGRKNDRVGLVAFGREAVTASPLTLDYQALTELLKGVDHGKLPEGTAIGHGLSTSVNLLRESRARSRIVVLLTDGQNNSGEIDPLKAARLAQLLGIKVYTIGVGGAVTFPGQRNPSGSGRQSMAPLFGVDEETLRRVSDTTAASYFRATDPDTLRKVYEQIEQLEKSQVGRQRYATLDELAPWLLLPALGLALIEVALATTVFRRFP